MHNIKFLLSRTTPNLELARDEAKNKGHQKLADFYHEKISEEEGHEAWADDDIRGNNSALTNILVSPYLSEMMTEVVASIRQNPFSYLGYVLLTEYFTVKVGGPWLEDLEKYCGISHRQVSVVDSHVELDKDHIQDDFRAIDQVCFGVEDQASVMRMVNLSTRLFRNFASTIVPAEFH